MVRNDPSNELNALRITKLLNKANKPNLPILDWTEAGLWLHRLPKMYMTVPNATTIKAVNDSVGFW